MGTQHRFSPLQTNQYGKVEAIIHMRILTNTFLISLAMCCTTPFLLFLQHCFQFLFYRTNLAAPCLIRTVFGSSASFNQMSKISSGQSCPMNTKFFENVVFFLLCTLGGRWGPGASSPGQVWSWSVFSSPFDISRARRLSKLFTHYHQLVAWTPLKSCITSAFIAINRGKMMVRQLCTVRCPA